MAGRKQKIEWDERRERFMARAGEILRKKREYAGLTAQELGDRVGLSRPTISGIELGQRDFLASYFDRFAEALNINVVELLPQTTAAAYSALIPSETELTPSQPELAYNAQKQNASTPGQVISVTSLETSQGIIEDNKNRREL